MWLARQKVGFSPRAMMIEGRSSSGKWVGEVRQRTKSFFQGENKGVSSPLKGVISIETHSR